MLPTRFRVGQLNGLTFLERTRDRSDLSGQFFSDFRGRSLRFKKFRLGEHRAQQVQHRRTVDVRIGELVRLLHRAVEIRADDVAIEIADYEQRWVKQRFAITQQLLIRCIEVLLFAFVFPSETTFLPNVCEPALAIGVWFLGDSSGIFERKKFGVFNDSLLKTKRFAAGRISSCRRWLT